MLIVYLLFQVSCTREYVITDDQLDEDMLYLETGIIPFSGDCKLIYRKSGSTRGSFSYKNGKTEGIATGYYPDGNLKWKGNFKDGLMTGIWLFYDGEGNKIYEMEYKNDSLHGKFVSWNREGIITEESKYAMNTRIMNSSGI